MENSLSGIEGIKMCTLFCELVAGGRATALARPRNLFSRMNSLMIISSVSTAAQNNTPWRKKVEGTGVAEPG